MITLEIMDPREYSLPLEGNLHQGYKRYSRVVSDISGALALLVYRAQLIMLDLTLTAKRSVFILIMGAAPLTPAFFSCKDYLIILDHAISIDSNSNMVATLKHKTE